ncbi:reverse transcriptase domain-containing protein [Tanacetum coccineum]
MVPSLVAPSVSVLAGCDRLVSEPQLAMPSHFHKKFRWGTVFATGCRSFIEPGSGHRMKRTNCRTQVLIGLYPCHIEEKMTIREVRGESVMEWKTKVTTKEGTIIKFPRKFRGYKLETEEEVEENEGLKENIIPQIVTQVTANVNNVTRGNGNGRNNGCSYKTFTAYNPKEFDGKGGVVALTHWIEKMESVFDNSGCTVNQRVRVLLMEEFCPSNEMEKLENEFWNHTMVGANHVAYTDRFHELAKLVPYLPTTIQSVILTAEILTDEAVRCGTLTKGNDKRKEMEESSKQGSTGKDNKKSKIGSGFVATVPPRNENVSTYPKCARCYTFHPENAPLEALQDPKVVTGTFSLNNQFATVVFDSGVDFSFISTKFAPLLNVKPCIVNPGYVIEIADGESVEFDRIIRDCKLELGNSLFTIDLIRLGHGSFDVVMGMD